MSEIIIPAARIEGSYGGQTITYSIPPFFRDYFWHWEKFLKDKGVVHNQLRISQPFKPRTTGKYSQCNHFNGHVAQLSQYTGHSFEGMKMYIKSESISEGWPIDTGPDGVAYPKSEARVSTTEINAGIETCHRIAAELNFELREE